MLIACVTIDEMLFASLDSIRVLFVFARLPNAFTYCSATVRDAAFRPSVRGERVQLEGGSNGFLVTRRCSCLNILVVSKVIDEEELCCGPASMNPKKELTPVDLFGDRFQRLRFTDCFGFQCHRFTFGLIDLVRRETVVISMVIWVIIWTIVFSAILDSIRSSNFEFDKSPRY